MNQNNLKIRQTFSRGLGSKVKKNNRDFILFEFKMGRKSELEPLYPEALIIFSKNNKMKKTDNSPISVEEEN